MPPRKTGTAGKKKEETPDYEGLSVEDAFKKVDGVISAMHEDDITLESSFQKYKEGMDLLKYASSLIDRVEKDALKITEDGGLFPLDLDEDEE